MVVAAGDVRLSRFLRREAGAEVDRLYRRHADEVLRYATLVLRSRTDAEDVTQTVFMLALRAIERGEKVRTPRNWLIKIAHNECRRLFATRKLHAELPDEIPVEPAEPGRAEELRIAMAALPATQRHALVLRELEGRTYEEISRTLDLSVSAVETLIFRARRALREQIENAITCEEFAAMLDEPAARTRVRAHARVCPGCATLDHQSRGRKSALKRIASAFGLPWWGTKLAAVVLTTATVAAVAAVPAVPHNQARPHAKMNLVPASKHLHVALSSVAGTRFKSFVSQPVHARPVVAALQQVPVAASSVPGAAAISKRPAVPSSVVIPGPATAPRPAPAPAPEPTPLPSPTKSVPADPPAAVSTPAPEPAPIVTVPQTVLPPVPEVPAVTIPVAGVPVSAPVVPAVTLPVETPKVSLP